MLFQRKEKGRPRITHTPEPAELLSHSKNFAAYAVGSTTLLALTVTDPAVFEPPRRRPTICEPLFTVIDVAARMLPLKIVVVSSVADVPTCQKTFEAFAPPVRITCAPGPVVSVDPILKIKIAFGSPCASSVTLLAGPAP